jgi:site-specific recombinase
MTVITDPRSNRVQAIFLKGHCQLMAKGMSARGLTKSRALKLAGDITGKKYKRGEHAVAADDLKKFLDETK